MSQKTTTSTAKQNKTLSQMAAKKITPATPPSHTTRTTMRSMRSLLREETMGFHGRLLLAKAILAPWPIYTGNRTRARILRLCGFRHISTQVTMCGTPTITGSGNIYSRLHIGAGSFINIHCFFNLGSDIHIGKHVAFGHEVMVLTESHAIGPASRRCGSLTTAPVTIADGCWIGARATILPGVTIGAGSIVAAGALVNTDVPPNTVVAGIPARPVRSLDTN